MTRFEQVVRILDASVAGGEIGAHGAFWRGIDRQAFVARKVYGEQLLIPGDPSLSNLVLALRGKPPFGVARGDPGAQFPRMPARMPPVAEADIVFIEQWIADGCPDGE